MQSDFIIAKGAKKLPIETVASKLKIDKKHLFLYGKYIAKINSSVLEKNDFKQKGKLILVTAITPTPLGEGKTVTTIGLSMALNKIGKLASACIRQPSMGPVFGIKGSAGGGGFSQVLPREDFDLHFTGDAHAVGLAHNLAAAFLDNSLLRKNKFNIDTKKIYWRRIVDIGDRFLRNCQIGLGGNNDGIPRMSGFDITASSEIMAILGLSNNLKELRKKIAKIVLALDKTGKPVTAEDIKAAGLMTVLLKDAIKPNLIQTIENTPCFVHTGPFANIAHGNSSIIQDKIALNFSDYVVTEAGFGADCGAEKFFNLKCRIGKLKPSVAVIVCSLRAIKSHAGICKITPGKPLAACLKYENLDALKKGITNLEKQIENIKLFGIPVVVAINRFNSDGQKELDFVKAKALEFGADDCCISEVWKKGSKGAVELARSVVRLSGKNNNFKFLYPLNLPIKAKIEIIAKKIYGARKVSYSQEAEKKIKDFTKRSWDNLPICMAKTHLSLTADPHLVGRPKDFVLPIRDIRAYIGAGFLSPLCGKIQTMPGLPSHPRGENIDIDSKGNIVGLT